MKTETKRITNVDGGSKDVNYKQQILTVPVCRRRTVCTRVANRGRRDK